MISEWRYVEYVPAAFIAFTRSGECSTPEKMNSVPIRIPTNDPGGLNACEKLSRRSEVSGSPNCAISGFAAVSRIDWPQPATNSASRNGTYLPITAAGQ